MCIRDRCDTVEALLKQEPDYGRVFDDSVKFDGTLDEMCIRDRLLINADINEHTALTVTINRLSLLARKEFPIFSPIFLAIPFSKSAALTTHIPTTIGQPVALNPLYTADKYISGINIAIATDPRICLLYTSYKKFQPL